MVNILKNRDSLKGEIQSPRVIGLLAGVSVVVGSMLGVGIFLFPQIIAAETGSVVPFFILWLLGGVYALSGSVALGELGAMIPKAGGEYVFQRQAYGASVAFASGWVLFVAIFGGSIAGMSVALFQYQFPALLGIETCFYIHPALPVTLAHLLAVILILALTLMNHFGTRVSTVFQVVVTMLPIVLIVVISFTALDWSDSARLSTLNGDWLKRTSVAGLLSGFLMVNFAYSGWLNIVYVAGDVKHPGKNIPRSMFLSVMGISLLYCFLCAVFIAVLGFDGLAALVNVDAGTAMASETGNNVIRVLVLLAIAMAIITSLNVTILTSSRVAYAMAGDGAFWKGAAKLGGKSRTPRNALWIQALLASVLVLSGSFSAIIEMTSIAMLLTGTLTVASMFVLRVKNPLLARPYRAHGYPWFPGLYLVLSIVVLTGVTLKVFNSEGIGRFYPLIGIGVLVLAFAGHYFLNRDKN